MAKAKYTVFIPAAAHNVSIAAHHYLTYGPLRVDAATVHHGTPYDTLLVHADDTPEMDSHLKQLGVFAGEIANEQAITVAKEGPKTHATWTMRNPHYQPPMPQAPQNDQGPAMPVPGTNALSVSP